MHNVGIQFEVFFYYLTLFPMWIKYVIVVIVPVTTEGGCPTAQSPSNIYQNLYNNQLQIDLFQKKFCVT